MSKKKSAWRLYLLLAFATLMSLSLQTQASWFSNVFAAISSAASNAVAKVQATSCSLVKLGCPTTTPATPTNAAPPQTQQPSSQASAKPTNPTISTNKTPTNITTTAPLFKSAESPEAFKPMPFTGIVLFGDSLSDIGNTKDLLKILNNEDAPSFSKEYRNDPNLQLHSQSQYLIYPAEYQYPDNSFLHKAQYGVYNTMLRWLADALIAITDTSNAIPLVPRDFYDEPDTGGRRFSNGDVWIEEFARRSGISDENHFTVAKTIEHIQSDSNRPGFPFYTEVGDRLYNRAFGGSWVAPNKRQQWKRNNRVVNLESLIEDGKNLGASKVLYGMASKSNFTTTDAISTTAQLAMDPIVNKSIDYLKKHSNKENLHTALESKDVAISGLGDYLALFQDLATNKVIYRLLPPNINLVAQSYIREKDHYIPEMNKKIDTKALYVVYGGGNDYLNMQYIDVPIQSVGEYARYGKVDGDRYRYPKKCTSDVLTSKDPNVILMRKYVDNVIFYLSDTVKKLNNAGGKNFLMGTLPYFSDAPEYTHYTPPAYANDATFDRTVFQAGLDCAIDYHNYRLRTIVYELDNLKDKSGNPQYLISLFNVNKLIQDALKPLNHSQVNIPSYAETSCTHRSSTNVSTDKDKYLYYNNEVLDTVTETMNNSSIKAKFCSATCEAGDKDCTIGCVEDKLCVADHVFWDNVHPTKRIHKYIGESLCSHTDDVVEFYYPSSQSGNNTCPR